MKILTAIGLATGAVNAASISVNFHINTNDANMVDSGETAFNGVTGAETVAGANVTNVDVNTVAVTTSNNLQDNTGTGTGVNLSTSATFFTAFSNNSSPNQAATGNGGLGQSSIYIRDTESITLTGLNAFSGSYNLILLFDASAEHGGRTYGFTVNDGGGAQSLFTNDTNTRDADTNNDGLFDLIAATGTTIGTPTLDANIATFTGLTGDTLTISGGQNSTRSPLLGFQLVAVPEPSSTALLGLGGLALMLRRRK